MPFSENVDLLGYHDLEGRAGFKLALHEKNGAFFLYVASLWEPGFTILNVTDPARPIFVRWMPGPPNTWTIQVQIAGKIMITSLEHIPGGWSNGEYHVPEDGFLIWDLEEPDNPRQIGRWKSGGTGTHRNFYSGGNTVHVATSLDGFEGQIYAGIDITDPESPFIDRSWWWPGQNVAAGERYSESDVQRSLSGKPFPTSESSQHPLSLHGGAYVEGNRVYAPWMRAGLVILDILDKKQTNLVSNLSFYPPLGSTIAVHTAVPLLDRNLLVVNSEALRESCDEAVGFAGIVDIANELDPILISLFPQPRTPKGYPTKTFCQRGGRFGPHNQHQPQGQSCLAPVGQFIYLTYFNAGLQIFDISEPRDPFIAGFYIPDDPIARRGPLPKTLVVQAEDVLVDRRGVIYMSEKNSGIYLMSFEALAC